MVKTESMSPTSVAPEKYRRLKMLQSPKEKRDFGLRQIYTEIFQTSRSFKVRRETKNDISGTNMAIKK
jgi:hypothetical protein